MRDEPERASLDGLPTASSYEREYEEIEAATEYNQAYETRLLKRSSTRREFQLLERLLGSRGRCRTLLDVPCGGGRLSATLGRYTDLLIEADVALGQIHYGRRHRMVTCPRLWMTASAFRIPLRDAAVDAAVCIRLSHHLPEKADREKLLVELLRVAARFVIVTFFDHHSLKNLLRRARQPFNHKPPKHTMTAAAVRDIARRHGADLAACLPLSLIGSGHRYALLVKT